MKKYFNVSFQYSDDVFCANIAHAESAEDVEKHYSEKYEWCKVSEATAADVEEAQRKGKPIVEIEIPKKTKAAQKKHESKTAWSTAETEKTSEDKTTDEGQQIEFRRLDELGEFIGLAFPEEIHDFAAAEGWYKRNEQGDPELDRDELNDFLRRYGAGIVCRSLTGGICCEIVND